MGLFGRGTRPSGPGTVWGWGSNFGGLLGERPGDRNEPTQIPRLSHVSAIHLGGHSAYAIMDSGSVWSWGSNDNGQLGDGKLLQQKFRGIWSQHPNASAADAGHRPIPARIQGLSDVKAIFGNSYPGMWATSRDGRVLGWGSAVGHGRTGDIPFSPVRLPVLDGVLDVANSMNVVWARMPDGKLLGWNRHFYKSDTFDRTLPRRVAGNAEIASISAGTYALYATTRDGAVWASDNFHGELRDGSGDTFSLVPGRGSDIDGIARVIAADYDPAGVLAIGLDGSLWSWGGDAHTWNTGREHRYPPRRVPIPVRVVDANQHQEHAYAIDEGGDLWSWDDHALMSGADQRPQVSKVRGLPRIAAFAHGSLMHALGLDGTVWIWSSYHLAKDREAEPRRVSGLPFIVGICGNGSTTLALAGG